MKKKVRIAVMGSKKKSETLKAINEKELDRAWQMLSADDYIRMSNMIKAYDYCTDRIQLGDDAEEAVQKAIIKFKSTDF